MKTSKVIISLFMGIVMLTVQVGSVLAAPALKEGVIDGTVTALECTTPDGASILVTFDDENGVSQQTEIDLETAQNLGLVTMGEDGKPDCSEGAFQAILVSLSEDEPQHPVGAALAAIFSQITDYETIMQAHDGDGEFEEIGPTGFGVIAQALWITKNYLTDGSEADFWAILEAKKTGEFSYFSDYFPKDGSTPQNWGQFKKAMLYGDNDKKNNLGAVMSDKDNKTNNGKGPDKENKSNNSNKDKDKDKGG